MVVSGPVGNPESYPLDKTIKEDHVVNQLDKRKGHPAGLLKYVIIPVLHSVIGCC